MTDLSELRLAPSGEARRRDMSVLSGRAGLVLLVDPERTTAEQARELGRLAAGESVGAVLVGSSFGGEDGGRRIAALLREALGGEVPLVQFPATASHLLPEVDAVLLLSLVSGRNPQYLIEEHVRAVPFFDAHPEIGVISTAYLLVDGGRVTSVESVSQTRPLAADKPELVAAHVRAAALIGMEATYLDAGSGARDPVHASLVQAARRSSAGPLLVGGGIRERAAVRGARDAGADLVVVGTAVERGGLGALRDLATAARA